MFCPVKHHRLIFPNPTGWVTSVAHQFHRPDKKKNKILQPLREKKPPTKTKGGGNDIWFWEPTLDSKKKIIYPTHLSHQEPVFQILNLNRAKDKIWTRWLDSIRFDSIRFKGATYRTRGDRKGRGRWFKSYLIRRTWQRRIADFQSSLIETFNMVFSPLIHHA